MEEILQEAPIVDTKRGVHPLFILSIVTITTVVVSALVWRWTNTFTAADKNVALSHLTPAKILEFGGYPSVVNVGLYIKNFHKFDIVKNEFIFDGILWFEFDPSLTSLETIERAKFERAEILEKSAPYTRLDNGKLFARYNVRIKFTAELSYAYFPVDDHRISLTLVHKSVTPAEVIFEGSNRNFIIEPDLSKIGWYKVGQDVESGYVESKLDPLDQDKVISYPALVFSMDYSRGGSIRNTITIMLPLLILFFLSLFSLILDPIKSWSSIVSVSVQGITGLIAFRFVMEALSPTVGYFMYSDYFFFLFLGMAFIIFFINVFGATLAVKFKQLVIVLLNVTTIGIMWYLLYL